jgi:hypothetical protein
MAETGISKVRACRYEFVASRLTPRRGTHARRARAGNFFVV